MRSVYYNAISAYRDRRNRIINERNANRVGHVEFLILRTGELILAIPAERRQPL